MIYMNIVDRMFCSVMNEEKKKNSMAKANSSAEKDFVFVAENKEIDTNALGKQTYEIKYRLRFRVEWTISYGFSRRLSFNR